MGAREVMSISIVKGSLLDAHVDAIVNPANLFLRNGAGLARIIDKAARGDQNGRNYTLTPSQREYERQLSKVPTISTGNVAVTSAGVLPFRGIIHAVGPVWTDGSYCEGPLLHRVHERICEEAISRGWQSVGIPAISCGLFRFPAERAAPYAVAGVLHALAQQDLAVSGRELDVRFYLMEDGHVSAWTKALDNPALRP